ncbi:MAG TPA: 2-dehydro-3-deoxy-6-phosphogalactonate aldolase [Burkholderiaceae bacterium]
MQDKFNAAFAALPLVAILRGVTPDEAEPIALALYEAGFRLIEVPLNSPQALVSITRLASCLPGDAVMGAGTVLSSDAADKVRDAGGQLIVMPHADPRVIRHVKAQGLLCIPGAATPTEAFACVEAGADAVKLFPAELVTPTVVKAMRAVLPPGLRLLPVGGIAPDSMAAYRKAGAAGFGLGGALYTPGMSVAEVAVKARAFVSAWNS